MIYESYTYKMHAQKPYSFWISNVQYFESLVVYFEYPKRLWVWSSLKVTAHGCTKSRDHCCRIHTIHDRQFLKGSHYLIQWLSTNIAGLAFAVWSKMGIGPFHHIWPGLMFGVLRQEHVLYMSYGRIPVGFSIFHCTKFRTHSLGWVVFGYLIF